MADFQVTLTAEERQHLADLPERTQKGTRVEVHRTRTPGYREPVPPDEDSHVHLPDNLRRPSA